MADGGFRASPEAMRAAVGNVGGILVQAINALRDLESLLLEPTSFTTLGSPVAEANTELHGRQVRAMRSLLWLLQQTNDSVHRSANDYEDTDAAIATGYGGAPLWHPTPAADLAGYAVTDSTGAPGEPYSVTNVLTYLSRAGVGDLSRTAVADVSGTGMGGAVGHPAAGDFADAGGFADWLDTSPDHQSRLGVIGVYSGDEVRSVTEVPGVQRGDVVVAGPVIGVAGGDGLLYNHGPVGPDLPYGGQVRVYRPLAAPAT